MTYSLKVTALKNGKNLHEVIDQNGKVIGTRTSNHHYAFAIIVRRRDPLDEAGVLAYSQNQRPLSARERGYLELLGYAS